MPKYLIYFEINGDYQPGHSHLKMYIRRYFINHITKTQYSCTKMSKNELIDFRQTRFQINKENKAYRLNSFVPQHSASGCIYFTQDEFNIDQQKIKDYSSTLKSELYNKTHLSINDIENIELDTRNLKLNKKGTL